MFGNEDFWIALASALGHRFCQLDGRSKPAKSCLKIQPGAATQSLEMTSRAVFFLLSCDVRSLVNTCTIEASAFDGERLPVAYGG